jgi:hypothetical protein
MFQEQYFFIDCTGNGGKSASLSSRSSTEGHKGSIFGDAWRSEDGLSCEQRAVEAGIYKARYGTVSLLSAKSVLNRYAYGTNGPYCSLVARSVYCSSATLQSSSGCPYLSALFVWWSLPESYHSESNKTRENTMALMACVRLPNMAYLSERLLPLSERNPWSNFSIR